MIHEEKKDHTEDETCRDELKVALASVGFSLFFLFFSFFHSPLRRKRFWYESLRLDAGGVHPFNGISSEGTPPPCKFAVK